MLFTSNTKFSSWDSTVQFTPKLIFIPKTIEGVKNLVKWVNLKHPDKRIRVSGYHHTSSELYGVDGDIIVSLLDLDTITLPATYPKVDPNNDLQKIEIVSEPYLVNGEPKILVKVGAAICNYHFQDWLHSVAGGNNQWMIPFNVVLTEVTFGGIFNTMCHGAGISHKVLGDLVKEIEFVNARGELQRITDPQQLKSAVGNFGLLGPVTSITVELNSMIYANLKESGKEPLSTAIPPPNDRIVYSDITKHIGHHNRKTLYDVNEQNSALQAFIHKAENSYYAEWLLFPLQNNVWSNCWKPNPNITSAKRYPDKSHTEIQRFGTFLVHLADKAAGKHFGKLGKIQTKLNGTIAMSVLPNHKEIICSGEDALHFQQGIQNLPSKLMEMELPIPDGPDGEADWNIVQNAWWDMVEALYSEKNMQYFPVRTVCEMRIMNGSDSTMAAQYNNKRTCAIGVVTSAQIDNEKWQEFLQELLDKWVLYKDYQGHYLNIRPHWAKQFKGLYINRGIDWLYQCSSEEREVLSQFVQGSMIHIPIEEYLKYIAYRNEIPKFKNDMQQICHAGGYELSDLQRFSNPFLNNLFSLNENTPTRQYQYRF